MPSNDYKWVIQGIECSDADSGLHTIVEIKYQAYNTTKGGASVIGGGEDKQISWKLQWGELGATAMIYLDPDKNGGYVKGATLPTNLIKDWDPSATMKTIPAVRSYCQRTTSSMKYVMGDYEYQRGAVIWGLATN